MSSEREAEWERRSRLLLAAFKAADDAKTPPLSAEAAPTPLTYSLAAAAEKLGGPFTVDFLKGHLAEIPHIKTGTGRGRAGRIAFSEQHLIQIVDKFTVAPAGDGPGGPEFPSMASPRGRRRRALPRTKSA